MPAPAILTAAAGFPQASVRAFQAGEATAAVIQQAYATAAVTAPVTAIATVS
jgi:hypothetical protein